MGNTIDNLLVIYAFLNQEIAKEKRLHLFAHTNAKLNDLTAIRDKLKKFLAEIDSDEFDTENSSSKNDYLEEDKQIDDDNLSSSSHHPAVISIYNVLNTRYLYDTNRLRKTLACLDELLSMIHNREAVIRDLAPKLDKKIQSIKNNIERVLQSVMLSGEELIRYRYSPKTKIVFAAILFGYRYIPFNQDFDPYAGMKSKGYCWGYEHRWGNRLENNSVEDVSSLSDSKVLELQADNFGVMKYVLQRKLAKFKTGVTKQADFMWSVLEDLNHDDILYLSYKTGLVMYHVVGLRRCDSGIEFDDSNYGRIMFKNEHDFVNFFVIYMSDLNNKNGLNSSSFYVWKMADKNKHRKTLPKANITMRDKCKVLHGHSDLFISDKEEVQNIIRLKQAEIIESAEYIEKIKHSEDKVILSISLKGTLSYDIYRLMIQKIKKELSRLENTLPLVGHQALKQKTSILRNDLDKYTSYIHQYAMKHTEMNSHDCACLLFALIKGTLKINRGFGGSSQAYKTLKQWVSERHLSPKLINQFTKDIVSHTQSANELKESHYSASIMRRNSPDDDALTKTLLKEIPDDKLDEMQITIQKEVRDRIKKANSRHASGESRDSRDTASGLGLFTRKSLSDEFRIEQLNQSVDKDDEEDQSSEKYEVQTPSSQAKAKKR